MAIKNTLLGGTDWTSSDNCSYADLNDTFDALFEFCAGQAVWYLNSNLYDVYDDFDSYSTGTFSTNTDWEIIKGGESGVTETAEIVESTNAGGSTKELKLTVQGDENYNNNATVTAKTINLPANKSFFCRIYAKLFHVVADDSSWARLRIGLGNATAITVMESKNDFGVGTYAFLSVLVVAKGSNTYDVYVGGKKIISGTVQANPQLSIIAYGEGRSGEGCANIYIDDVRSSK